jgi:hypothetical protein
MKKILTTAITILALSLSVGGLVFAQTTGGAKPGSGQALEIGPPVITLSGNPGQTVQAQLNLRDVSPEKLVVTNEINDFIAGDENGTPKILLNKNETSPYSMKTWINPLPKFTLVPKQIQTLTLTIKIPKNAAPGGYYSVIRFSGTPPGLEGTGVSLSASLGSLVLLKVNGEAKEQMSVEEFYTASKGKKTSLFESAPITLTERLNNIGNIHEQPVGVMTITDMFGKNVASFTVNQEQRNVLPHSIRKFEQVIDSSVIGNKFLFGKYTAKIELAYGSGVKPLVATVDFWVIPYTLIAIIIVTLIALFFAIRFALRSYARRVVNQTGRRRR